jgi:hypothetical protein
MYIDVSDQGLIDTIHAIEEHGKNQVRALARDPKLKTIVAKIDQPDGFSSSIMMPDTNPAVSDNDRPPYPNPVLKVHVVLQDENSKEGSYTMML